MRLSFAAIGAALAIAAPALATSDDLRSVAGMEQHNRVLLVFSPSLRDPRLAAQQRELAKAALDAAARDLLLVQVSGGTVIGASDRADKLRRRFKVPPTAYRTFLIGKSGRIPINETGPIAAARLIHTIDTLPIRREEVRRAKAGLPQRPR